MAHFQTNILLKDILGKGMINDDNLAIIELVKNSMDANATVIDVDFNFLTDKTKISLFNQSDKKQQAKIIIKDNGFGMDDKDIVGKWLNIAYSEKKDKSDITSNVFAGDKGVGRFSCDRLGRILNLYTKKEGKSIFHFKIDWTLFEKGNQNTTIQSINIDINEISKEELRMAGLEIGEHGTILDITDLRIDWNKTKIKTLKSQYLSKLLNPNQKYVKNNIEIRLNVPDYEEFSGKIDNQVFQKLEFRTTSIEAFTEVLIENEGEKEIKNLYVTTILKHKGEDVIKIREKNNRFINLKNVRIVIYYLNSYAKVRFLEDSGERTKDYGSIFLFLNGFRVSPYGEAGNDWLGLEMRRSQGQKRFFSARDIVGRIEVTDFEGTFKPVSSREGLVNDNTFSLLVDKDAIKEGYDDEDEKKEYGLFYQILTALEKYVVVGLKWDSPISSKYVDEFEEELMNENDLKNELYAETDSEKNKRNFDVVQSILRTRKGEIVDVKINETLLLQLQSEDEEKAKKFLKSLEKYNRKLDLETASAIEKIKNAIAEKERELEEQKTKLSAEEKARKEAEEKAKKEEKARKEAEEKTRKAEEKTKEEELKRKEAELKQREEEIKRKEAEQKAKEEEEKRKIEQENRIKAEKETKETKKVLEKKKEQLSIVTSISSQDLENVTNLHHQVLVITDTINTILLKASRNLAKGNDFSNDNFKEILDKISYEMNKIKSISRFGTRAIFEDFNSSQRSDIISFIEQYLQKVSDYFGESDIRVKFETNIDTFNTTFKPLDLSIIIDNIRSNAIKADANLLEIKCSQQNNSLEITFIDNGKGLHTEANEEDIFEKGFTTTKSTGLGLFHINNILRENKWKKQIINHKSKGFEFKIIINE